MISNGNKKKMSSLHFWGLGVERREEKKSRKILFAHQQGLQKSDRLTEEALKEGSQKKRKAAQQKFLVA